MNKPSTKAILEQADEQTLSLRIDGNLEHIPRDGTALKKTLEEAGATSLQTANKIYNIGNIGEATFNVIIEQVRSDAKLPEELSQKLMNTGDAWVKSLYQELLKRRVPVRDEPFDVFQRYGWMIETFLLKLSTEVGRQPTLRRLSFMTEVYQSSLRYLCYIQLSQLLAGNKAAAGASFFNIDAATYPTYDLLTLLIQLTEEVVPKDSFMPELSELIEDLLDEDTYLREVVIFLDANRDALVAGKIREDEKLENLLDEYLTALIYWLRQISFLAKYRLVSIKDINLNYQLGVPENFIHLYGELHGVYDKQNSSQNQVLAYAAAGVYTYNHSVLLLKGSSIEQSMERIGEAGAYLSLSPLIIDYSVYATKFAQTPEIYYYAGKGKRRYHFAKCKNELAYGEGTAEKSNKHITIHKQNNEQPKHDELYEQLDLILNDRNAGSL